VFSSYCKGPCWIQQVSLSHLTRIFKVPLNYSEPDGKNAIIALTRIPSPLPTNSPWYRGPILINPGGPGGSGVEAIMRFGGALSAIVGPQFDVVGFDPRGLIVYASSLVMLT
jgi:pimeloyl-ACP methyl ester carboxylesterase